MPKDLARALWVAICRARESERPDAIFHDPYARRLGGARGEAILRSMPGGTSTAWPIVVRTAVMDEIVSACVREGAKTVLPSFAAAVSGLDARTHAQKTLDALEAWIESRDMGVAEYQIGDKQLKSLSIPDLLKLRDRYRREVRESVGPKKSGRVQLRF